MKTLVVSDIHGRNFWRSSVNNALADERIGRIIFLGDYLDPYSNEITENPNSMECTSFKDSDNLLKMLDDIFSLKKDYPDKIILLTGNHTDSYIWSDFSAATRTDGLNWKKYNKFFSENLNLFNFVWIENSTIFSHAGISKGWADMFLYTYMKYDEGAELENDSKILETAIVLRDTPLKDFNAHYVDAISDISHYRGGDMFYGSCEWADIREHIDHHKTEIEEKIVPLGEDGLYQIFGHTQLLKELITEKWACLDCRKVFVVDTVTHEITDY